MHQRTRGGQVTILVRGEMLICISLYGWASGLLRQKTISVTVGAQRFALELVMLDNVDLGVQFCFLSWYLDCFILMFSCIVLSIEEHNPSSKFFLFGVIIVIFKPHTSGASLFSGFQQ
ncbi:hypothetical protein BJ742DRAFT_402748 [Cladochytrium replicatum]|nr:hypothetical protein BJ742DRAFT_402748 [Cladochytrium replicatum]